jgi:hypothetical protein
VRPACPTHKEVVLQPNDRDGFAIVHDDIAWHPKMLWETCIMHVASERLWPQSLRTKATSLPVITSSTVRVPHEVLGLCVFVPPAALMTRLGF